MIETRLMSITPGDILLLFKKYSHIHLMLCQHETFKAEGLKGVLSSTGKRAWVIHIIDWGVDQNHHTLIHECLHLILIAEGLDDCTQTQAYSEFAVEEATDKFLLKYPHFPEQLWKYMHKIE